MPSNKSPGPDIVSMNGPVTNIINCSFATSVFPDEWKLAEVIPILKDGDHEVASNNRPLSLLNAVSKICERAVLNEFKSYLMRNKRLSRSYLTGLAPDWIIPVGCSSYHIWFAASCRHYFFVYIQMTSQQ